MLKMPENHERQGFHASKLKSGKEKHAQKESRGTLDHFVKESEPEIEVLRANKVPLCRISGLCESMSGRTRRLRR